MIALPTSWLHHTPKGGREATVTIVCYKAEPRRGVLGLDLTLPSVEADSGWWYSTPTLGFRKRPVDRSGLGWWTHGGPVSVPLATPPSLLR